MREDVGCCGGHGRWWWWWWWCGDGDVPVLVSHYAWLDIDEMHVSTRQPAIGSNLSARTLFIGESYIERFIAQRVPIAETQYSYLESRSHLSEGHILGQQRIDVLPYSSTV